MSEGTVEAALRELAESGHAYGAAVRLAGSYPGHEEYVESEMTEIQGDLDDADMRFANALDVADAALRSRGSSDTPEISWTRKDLLASCELLVNAQTTMPYPPPTVQITPSHAKEILKMAGERGSSDTRLTEAHRGIALTLAWSATASSKVGDEIPQAVWDSLHAEGLIRTVRDIVDEADTQLTPLGIEALHALAAARADAPQEQGEEGR